MFYLLEESNRYFNVLYNEVDGYLGNRWLATTEGERFDLYFSKDLPSLIIDSYHNIKVEYHKVNKDDIGWDRT